MNNVSNLGSQFNQWVDSFSEKRPVATDLAIVVASVAAGELIGEAITLVASTPIGLTVDLGVAAGVLMGIALVAYRRFQCGEKVSPFEFWELPSELRQKIASDLNSRTLGALGQANKASNILTDLILNERMKKAVAFGKEQWLEFFGLEVLDEPALPGNIIEILNGPCPADPTKKMSDTHMLTLIPEGQTLKSLGELVSKRFSTATGYCYIYQPILDQLDTPNKKSYWVLMKKDVIGGFDFDNGTRNKSVKEQESKLVEISEECNINYTLPTVLEAVASILAHQARSSSGERLFSNNTYTRCQEEVNDYRVVVGGFTSAGLYVTNSCAFHRLGFIGASGALRWRPAEVPALGPR